MVVQYPDTLVFKTSSSESIYDQETGEWSESVPGESGELKCRAEMNSQGNVVKSNDGTQLDYAFTIYMEVDAPVFKYGQLVEVYNKDGLLLKDAVKHFSRGQLNARLWA